MEARRRSVQVAAHHWLLEAHERVTAATPESVRDKLDPAEVFPQILDHRWYLSEAAGSDVGMRQAARSFFATVLPMSPDERVVFPHPDDTGLEETPASSPDVVQD
jgi:hypothetical protein